MTTIDPPWELSQITEKARAKHDRRRTRRLLISIDRARAAVSP